MVGRHEIAKQGKRAGALDANGSLRSGNLEIGRAAHVRGGLVPGKRRRLRGLDGAPGLLAVHEAEHAALVDVGRQDLVENRLDLCGRGHDVAQVDGRAVSGDADGIARKIDVHRSHKREGNDERRLGQEVLGNVGRDPAVKVAVAGQHARELDVRGEGL